MKKFHEWEAKSRKKATSIDPKKDEFKVEKFGGSSTRASMTRKKFETKMKPFKKIHAQLHDSDLNADEDWVTFVKSGGRFDI